MVFFLKPWLMSVVSRVKSTTTRYTPRSAATPTTWVRIHPPSPHTDFSPYGSFLFIELLLLLLYIILPHFISPLRRATIIIARKLKANEARTTHTHTRARSDRARALSERPFSSAGDSSAQTGSVFVRARALIILYASVHGRHSPEDPNH